MWAASPKMGSSSPSPSSGMGLQFGLISSLPSCSLPRLPSECFVCAQLGRPSVCAVDVDFLFFLFFFEILFAFAGLDSGKLSHSSDRSYGSSRGSYSTSSYPHQYCRSSGWSTGAGRVDNSYRNRGCPPRTDRCFSHGGNFQATFSRSPR